MSPTHAKRMNKEMDTVEKPKIQELTRDFLNGKNTTQIHRTHLMKNANHIIHIVHIFILFVQEKLQKT